MQVTLNEVYNEIIENHELSAKPQILAKLLEEPGNEKEKIFYFLDLREDLTMREHALVAKLKAGKDDNVQEVVFLANLTPGPVILLTKKRGYGLFAERTYERTDIVTRYGGQNVAKNTEGDYVLFNQVTQKTIDGKYGYKLSEKGRWINEFSRLTRKRNANKNVVFLASKDGILIKSIKGKIPFATEFFLNYGTDYNRSAYLDCVICGKLTNRVCGRCKSISYCSQECQRIDWHISHKTKCKFIFCKA